MSLFQSNNFDFFPDFGKFCNVSSSGNWPDTGWCIQAPTKTIQRQHFSSNYYVNFLCLMESLYETWKWAKPTCWSRVHSLALWLVTKLRRYVATEHLSACLYICLSMDPSIHIYPFIHLLVCVCARAKHDQPIFHCRYLYFPVPAPNLVANWPRQRLQQPTTSPFAFQGHAGYERPIGKSLFCVWTIAT